MTGGGLRLMTGGGGLRLESMTGGSGARIEIDDGRATGNLWCRDNA